MHFKIVVSEMAAIVSRGGEVKLSWNNGAYDNYRRLHVKCIYSYRHWTASKFEIKHSDFFWTIIISYTKSLIKDAL